MNKLPGKKLGSVVQIIHDRNHKVLQPNPDDNEEIEIDIDKIDDATLRFLDTFVKELYLTGNPTKGSGEEEEEDSLEAVVVASMASINPSTSKFLVGAGSYPPDRRSFLSPWEGVGRTVRPTSFMLLQKLPFIDIACLSLLLPLPALA
eukprot:756479-Hanusia_phi.AAC.3